MADAATWTTELRALEPSAWATYLSERSGLPGPRANLALVDVVAAVADPAVIEELLRDGGEYPTMCGAAAVGRRSNDAAFETRARVLATDERWRVREGVVIGLQHLGAASSEALVSIVESWVDDPSPLVQRAAVAAICEPRLLRTPDAAAGAIAVCQRATGHVAALTVEDRRRGDVRTLRQSLGYCWSVAIAAAPEAGLAAFRALDTSDPDIAWIVRENRRKKRLSALL